MALAYTITADQHAALSDVEKAHYTVQSDGKFKLSITDEGSSVFITDKDPTALMTALEHERGETAKAKAAANKLEAEKLAAERAGITDVEELTKSFQAQLDARDKAAKDAQKAAEKAKTESQATAAETLRKQTALKVSAELFGTNAAIMLPHVESIITGVPGETATVQYNDPATGQPAIDQNFDKWKESVSTHAPFAPMIVVSNASGGSANGQAGAQPSGQKADGTAKGFDDYKADELVAMRSTPEGIKQYDRLKAECSRFQ